MVVAQGKRTSIHSSQIASFGEQFFRRFCKFHLLLRPAGLSDDAVGVVDNYSQIILIVARVPEISRLIISLPVCSNLEGASIYLICAEIVCKFLSLIHILYTKNNEDIYQLLSKGRPVPQAMADDVLARNSIPPAGQDVNLQQGDRGETQDTPRDCLLYTSRCV